MASRENLQINVSKISVLCESLGYTGHRQKNAVTNQSEMRLRETTQSWRKNYITKDGREGSELRDWKTDRGRADLKAMALKYLEVGNGERFWPSDKSGFKYRYTSDQEEIVKLLMQMFWRQNYYDNHNAASRADANKRKSRESSVRGQTPQNPHVLEDSDCDEWPTRSSSHFGRVSPGPGGGKRLDVRRDSLDFELVTHPTTLARNSGSSLHDKGIPSPRSFTAPPRKPPREESEYVDDENELSSSTEKRKQKRSGRPCKKSPRLKKPLATPKKADGKPAQASSSAERRQKKRQKRQPRGSTPSPSPTRDRDRQRFGAAVRQSERVPQPRNHPGKIPIEAIEADAFGEEAEAPQILATVGNPETRYSDFMMNQPRQRHGDEDTAQQSHSLEASNSALSETRTPTPFAGMTSVESMNRVQQFISQAKTRNRQSSYGLSADVPIVKEKRDSHDLGVPMVKESSDSHDLQYSHAKEIIKPVTDAKSRIEVRFWIISSHQPRFERHHWPEGMLSGKSLDFFMQAARRITKNTQIMELNFMLKTAETGISNTVAKDDEKAFELMKSDFTKEIKLVWAKNRNQKENFEIWIDPIYGEDSRRDGQGDVEDIELAEF
ncbi:hypothetical protein MMC18_003497 [Xylographa bjoerkii]|nr:hypothetical protein [Xylographa bjoerkii]